MDWISQDFMLLNETLLEGNNQPGWRLINIQTTSRPDHIDKNLGKQCKEDRNKNERIEKLLFHAKDCIPKHAYGKPLFQNNNSRSVWSKIHLYWYCRGKTEFCVVLQLGTRIYSDEKICRKLFTKFSYFKVKAGACCLLATRGICGTKFFE